MGELDFTEMVDSRNSPIHDCFRTALNVARGGSFLKMTKFEAKFAKENGEFTTLEAFKEWIKDDDYPYNKAIVQFILGQQEGLCDSFVSMYYIFYDFYKKFCKREEISLK